MKTILISIDNLGGGGAEKVLINLLKNLNKDKYKITLLLLFNEGVHLKEVPEHVKIKYLFNNTSNLFRKLVYKTIKYIPASKMYKLFVKDTYDVEIAFLEGPTTKLISGSPNPNSKKIAWVHTDLSNNHWTKHYYKGPEEEKSQYENFNNIVFVSNDAKKGFEDTLQIFDHLHVIYNPIDAKEILDKANEEKIKNKKLTVISVGRLIEQKGYDRLIRVHAKLIKEGLDYNLILIGQGEDEKLLKQLTKDLDVEKNTQFLGFQLNPYKYVNAADVYISSSRVEGLPLVIAEALILKKPIISTKCSGPIELLDNGKYGMIVDNSEEGIYKGLKELILNKERRIKYSQLAVQRRDFFDINNVIYQIEELMDN